MFYYTLVLPIILILIELKYKLFYSIFLKSRKNLMLDKIKKNQINILFFGSSQQGKSSIIRHILKDEKIEIGGRAQGCTFSTEIYNYENLRIYDTIGLDEASQGKVDAKVSLKELILLLKDNEFSIMVFVKQKSSFKKSDERNLKLLSYMANQIPLICVITGCENEKCPFDWYEENSNIINQYCKFQCGLSGCYGHEKTLKAYHNITILKSINNLLEAIDKYSLETPIKCYNSWKYFLDMITTISIIVGEFFGWNMKHWKNEIICVLEEIGILDENIRNKIYSISSFAADIITKYLLPFNPFLIK